MIHFFISVIGACTLFVLGCGAWALPNITVERINGFEVHLVDIGAGDSFGLTYVVPFGTMNESGRLLGRDHLLEHMMHKGSAKRPGYHTMRERLNSVGLNANAYTAFNRTVYYASGAQEKAETILEEFLAPLQGLEWNPVTLASETKVVINEIQNEDMKREDAAFYEMPYIHLLPKDHPWSHPIWGNEQSLAKLTMTDLKELYYVNMTPNFVKVAVHGNFSDPRFLVQVKEWLGKYLRPLQVSNDPDHFVPHSRPLKSIRIPSLFSAPTLPPESAQRLYLASPSTRMTSIQFQADTDGLNLQPDSVDFLAQYLNLAVPGTFFYKLITEMEWATEAGFSYFTIGSQVHLTFKAKLTETGFKNRHEVNKMALEALRAAQLDGPPPAILKLFKDLGLNSLKQRANAVDSFLQTYVSFMLDKGTFAKQVANFSGVQPSQVAAAARVFSPDRALYVEMGPPIEGMHDSADYQRQFKIEDNRTEREAYMAVARASSAPKYVPNLRPVVLPPPSDEPFHPLFAHSRRGLYEPLRVALDFRQDLPDTALSIAFHLPTTDKATFLAMDLTLAAFNERFNGEQAYQLFAFNSSVDSARIQNILSFTSSSESKISLSAMIWQLEKLADFVPTAEELHRARERYLARTIQRYDSLHSSDLAVSHLIRGIDPLYLLPLERRQTAMDLDLGQVPTLWQSALTHSNKEIVMVGPFVQRDFQSLREAMNHLSPGSLDPELARQIWETDRWADSAPATVATIDEGKDPNNYGLARTYRGPAQNDVAGRAAFAALNSLLAMKVMNLNRSEQGLGYVHSTAMFSVGNLYQHLFFYGQANGAANAHLTVAGWETVLEELRQNKYTDAEIVDAITGVINTMNQKDLSARDVVKGLSGNLRDRADARAREKFIAALKQLSAEDVRQVASKYLLKPGAASAQLILGDCEKLLAAAAPG